jgi:hypothetical protein
VDRIHCRLLVADIHPSKGLGCGQVRVDHPAQKVLCCQVLVACRSAWLPALAQGNPWEAERPVLQTYEVVLVHWASLRLAVVGSGW